jgi:hypothetical protein
MSQRIRGQEATVNIIVDGDLKGGSFAKVTNFNLSPRTDITETPFLGEVEDDLDIQHHGHDFDFEIHQQDGKAVDVLKLIVSREENRLPHPAVNILVTLKHRDVSTPATKLVLQGCFMKADSLSIGGRKDFVTMKFSGKCKTVKFP